MPVLDASLCSDNRIPHSHEILSEIDANGDRHHSTILDESSNDVHALGRLIEISSVGDTIYNSGSLIQTKPRQITKILLRVGYGSHR